MKIIRQDVANLNIKIGNQEVKMIDKTTYLGSKITQIGNMREENSNLPQNI